MKTLRVAVAGAGLGGLCLAQGLLRAGADVTVYERDASLARRRQGYRLHVDARAGLALQACLPPESLAAFQATCGQASTRLTVVSEKLRVLHEQVAGDRDADPHAPATLSASVDRQTFREVLAAGLDGRIAFGHEVARYEAVRRRRAAALRGRRGGRGRRAGRRGRRPLRGPPPVPAGRRPIAGRGASTARPRWRPGHAALLVARASPPWCGGRIGMAIGLVRFRSRPRRSVSRPPGTT